MWCYLCSKGHLESTHFICLWKKKPFKRTINSFIAVDNIVLKYKIHPNCYSILHVLAGSLFYSNTYIGMMYLTFCPEETTITTSFFLFALFPPHQHHKKAENLCTSSEIKTLNTMGKLGSRRVATYKNICVRSKVHVCCP